MANYVYVDNSNVWIEGMHVSAVEKGMAPDIWAACAERICDSSWKLDFGRLFEFAAGSNVGRALLVGSRPPPDDSVWKAAESQGFEVIVHDRNSQNKEKKIDTEITTQILDDSYQLMNADQDTITLVSGDADYVPAIESLRKRRFNVEVCFWDHASRQLKSSANKFISLNKFLAHLNYNK